MAIGGRGGGSGRGGRDKVKPKRGGPRHFTVHPRDIYMKEGRPEGSEEESGSESGESGSEDELVQGVAAVSIGCTNDKDEDSSDESSEEEEVRGKPTAPAANTGNTGNRAPVQAPRGRPQQENFNRQNAPIPSDKPLSIEELTKKPAHELTRREREAIDKERARQHFLKMKEKEDAGRLAIVKKQREEAAAKAAAEKQAKEDARKRK